MAIIGTSAFLFFYYAVEYSVETSFGIKTIPFSPNTNVYLQESEFQRYGELIRQDFVVTYSYPMRGNSFGRSL